jgi:glyoxylase-like metal-dependent hydrolase (beta-lactamase superfamily II)
VAVRQEEEPPETGVREVAPDVIRLQLPIAMPGLGHVNCYAVPDARGFTIIDPGLPGPAAWRSLRDRLRTADIRMKDIHTVVVTHVHPDHCGAAGRLAKETGAELVTHSAFRVFWAATEPVDGCDDEIYDVDPDDLPEKNPFVGPTPWGRHSFEPVARRRLLLRLARLLPLNWFVPPRPTRRVRDGEILELAGRPWTAVHTPGHTLEHLCLYDPAHGTFLSGDHVLPTITPHISGLGSGRDPLKNYVESLDRVAGLPGVSKVLPAHGHPFTDLGHRVDSIKVHHVERMEKLREASLSLGTATVEELSHELFRPAVWGAMAESETYAHLEHLRLAGEAESFPGPDGRLRYRVTAAPAA